MVLNSKTKFVININNNDMDFIRRELQYYLTRVLSLKDKNFTGNYENSSIITFVLEHKNKNLLSHNTKKGFRITHKKDSIIIKSESSTDVVTGVYYWLEKFLNIRFWGLKIYNEEFIPKYKEIKIKDYDEIFKPYFKIRGVHLDVINHHYRDDEKFILCYIDWAVKNGYNLFNIKNDIQKYGKKFFKSINKTIKDRNVLLDALSHQWFDFIPPKLSRSNPKLFPIINGGVCSGEKYQYCFSNKEVRDKIINKSIAFIEQHPEIDVYPFWPNDGMNNWCECEKCKKYSPSDWYVLLANELLEKLAEKKIDVKLELIAYCNLIKPPEKVILKDIHNRVIFLFAPYHRKFRVSIGDTVLHNNKFKNNFQFNNMISGPEYDNEYKEYLKKWKKYLSLSSIKMGIFEYYQANADTGNVQLSRISYFPKNSIILNDLKFYKNQNMDFIINCPFPINSFYPNPLKSYIIAKSFLIKHLSINNIEKEFYEKYYGLSDIYEYFKLLEKNIYNLTSNVLKKMDKKIEHLNDKNTKFKILKEYHKYIKLINKSVIATNESRYNEQKIMDFLISLKNKKGYSFVKYFINVTKTFIS